MRKPRQTQESEIICPASHSLLYGGAGLWILTVFFPIMLEVYSYFGRFDYFCLHGTLNIDGLIASIRLCPGFSVRKKRVRMLPFAYLVETCPNHFFFFVWTKFKFWLVLGQMERFWTEEWHGLSCMLKAHSTVCRRDCRRTRVEVGRTLRR